MHLNPTYGQNLCLAKAFRNIIHFSYTSVCFRSQGKCKRNIYSKIPWKHKKFYHLARFLLYICENGLYHDTTRTYLHFWETKADLL
jgi:hypothetical protein